MYVIFFSICFAASIVGAICGIGGGVIIKPVLDASGILDVAAISFLSGCTVLSMTTYSVIKGKMSGESKVDTKTVVPISIGAALGGLMGKWMFSFISSLSPDKERVGVVQTICLLIVTFGTLVYTICKNKIQTHHVNNIPVTTMIGILLGILSSFLGIGGGPINLVVLFFFFSMSTKVAAENSLYIIFFSQLASLLSSLFTRSVPDFQIGILVLMVIGGIAGGKCGHSFNKKIDEKTVNKLFIDIMVLIILINIYNIYKFLG